MHTVSSICWHGVHRLALLIETTPLSANKLHTHGKSSKHTMLKDFSFCGTTYKKIFWRMSQSLFFFRDCFVWTLLTFIVYTKTDKSDKEWQFSFHYSELYHGSLLLNCGHLFGCSMSLWSVRGELHIALAFSRFLLCLLASQSRITLTQQRESVILSHLAVTCFRSSAPLC